MDKDFELAIGSFADCSNFGEREFARQGDAADAEALREPDAIGAGDTHLRAAVDFQVGRDLLRHADDAGVLHDDRVGSRLGDFGQRARRFVEFVAEDERVESDEALHPAPVEGGHHFRQFLQREPDLGARREVLEAEINGVRPGFDGSAQLWPVSGRAHDFGFTTGGHRDYLSG